MQQLESINSVVSTGGCSEFSLDYCTTPTWVNRTNRAALLSIGMKWNVFRKMETDGPRWAIRHLATTAN